MLVLSALLGVALTTNPLRLVAAAAAVWLAAAFFSCLSMSSPASCSSASG